MALDTSELPASGSTAAFATFCVILLGVGAVVTLLPPEELTLPPVRTVLAISFALPTVLMFILAAMPHSVAVTLVPPLAEMPFDALLDSARIQAGPPPESEAIERAEMFMDAVLVKTRASRRASGVVTATCPARLPSPVGEAMDRKSVVAGKSGTER